jgi:hypothetical protein
VTLDLTKPMQLRKSSKLTRVEFLRRINREPDGLVFLLTNPDGSQTIGTRCETGGLSCTYLSDFDVINTPPVKHKRWINIYRQDGFFACGVLHHSKQEALSSRYGDDSIACIEIEFTEGEGL